MKRLLVMFAVMILSGGLAHAQSDKTDKKSTPQTSEDSQPAPKPKTKKDGPRDLDAFFKEGEEQAKDGPSCRKPPEPVA